MGAKQLRLENNRQWQIQMTQQQTLMATGLQLEIGLERAHIAKEPILIRLRMQSYYSEGN